MLFNKKGFVLYDGIVSLLLLSSTMIFFNQVIVINNKLENENNNQRKIINNMYYAIDQNYPITIINGVKFYYKLNEYCGIYENQEICINT